MPADMRRLRARRSLVVLGLALVVLATVVPNVASALPDVILAPLWLIIPPVCGVVIRRASTRCHRQPVALLSVALFRAPPVSLALA
jgi:hypothetical protein